MSAFQPLDFFHFYGLWYDLWLQRIIAAFEKTGVEKKTYSDLKTILTTPSNLRALLQKAIPAYVGSGRKNPALYRRYTNFVARMLQESCHQDPFGRSSTPLHNQEEVAAIVAQTPWQEATAEQARAIGKLITAAGSLVHGLYNDVVTDYGWDAYGPYEEVQKSGQPYTLLIRNFPDLAPADIWPASLLPPTKSIQIFQLYQDVEWAIGCVGCHTIVKSGDPIKGLKYYAVLFDGKPATLQEIENMISRLSGLAENIYREIRKKGFEQLKELVMLQECYQLKKLFEAAVMDWRPTREMMGAVRNKPLLSDILPHDVMMTSLEQYKDVFHLNEFEKEVLKDK